MPYTDRQLHCLSAMGLVAWRARARVVGACGAATRTLPAGTGASTVSSLQAPVPASAPAPLVAPSLATPLPRDSAALAAWLPEQPLAPFIWKERRLTRVGLHDAPLFVVVERASEPAGGLPLAGEAAELFERMLESIGLSRRDTCQCVLASEPRVDADTVARAAGEHRAATLILLQEPVAGSDAAACRLPGDPFGGPAWCLPHPTRLLSDPLGKRLAWDVLKSVRAQLPASTHEH